MQLNETWLQILAVIGTNIALFVWARTEASSDRRQFQSETANDRREILQIIRGIQEEIRDFHGRLERQDAEFKSHMLHLHDNK